MSESRNDWKKDSERNNLDLITIWY
jgi:hypothetical protein